MRMNMSSQDDDGSVRQYLDSQSNDVDLHLDSKPKSYYPTIQHVIQCDTS